MVKAKLIEAIAKKTGLTKVETKATFVAFWKTIEETLARGESIELRGFGSFRVRHRRARNVRNPSTGETMQVEAKKIPVFKFSDEFKNRVDAGSQE